MNLVYLYKPIAQRMKIDMMIEDMQHRLQEAIEPLIGRPNDLQLVEDVKRIVTMELGIPQNLLSLRLRTNNDMSINIDWKGVERELSR